MNVRYLRIFAAAALALGAAAARAQGMGHDHSMHGQPAASGTPHKVQGPSGSGFAEGRVEKGIRVFDLAVTEDGFVPSRLVVNRGEKVRLVVTRKTNATCAKEIVVKDHGINQPLPLDKAVSVEFTPAKPGEIRFACGMDHVSGIVFVR